MIYVKPYQKVLIILVGYVVTVVLLLTECEGSSYWREKRGLIKEETREFTIQSIRVDDDAEYHVIAINKRNGYVKTIYDAHNGNQILIQYSNISTPTMFVKYSDRQEAGRFTEVCCEPDVIVLPYNFKIETFDD